MAAARWFMCHTGFSPNTADCKGQWFFFGLLEFFRLGKEVDSPN